MSAQQGPSFRFRAVLLLTAAIFAGVAAVFAGAGAAWAQELEVSRRDCERLNKHNAAAPADYQPGVDVRGKPVEGADLDGGAGFKLPDKITIPVGVDLAARYGMDENTTAQAETAAVTVMLKNGEVRLNGEPLDTGTESAVRRACLEAYGE